MRRNKTTGIIISVLMLMIFLFSGIVTPAVYADEQVPEAEAELTAEQSEEEAPYDPSAEPTLAGDRAVLIEAETGRVLFAKDAETAASPASMTKIMTGYLAILNGNLTDRVAMTQTGVDMAYSGSANLYTQVGEEFTLEQLLYGTLVYSANDMATQIAEYIGGSVPQFLEMMNEKALELGCTNTHFATPCGYPDEGNAVSAHDIAIITRAAMENETFRTIIGTTKYVIPQTNMTDHDRVFETRVIMKNDPQYLYEGVIGGKTGNTDLAGNCLSVACEKDGMMLIAVVMHAPSIQEAAADAAKLFDYGYYNFEKTEIRQEDFPDYSGMAIVRKGIGTDGLTVTETVSEEDGTAMHLFEYYDGDLKAGTVAVPEEVYQAWLDEKMAESEAEEEEPVITETPEPTVTPVPVIRKKVEFPKSFQELVVWLDDGANRLLFILVILILLAFILAFVLWVKQLGRRRRRRKRRKALKKQGK